MLYDQILKRHKYFKDSHCNEDYDYQAYNFHHVVRGIEDLNYHSKIEIHKDSNLLSWSYWLEGKDKLRVKKHYSDITETPLWFQRLFNSVLEEFKNDNITVTRHNPSRSTPFTSTREIISTMRKDLDRFLKANEKRSMDRQLGIYDANIKLKSLLSDVQQVIHYISEVIEETNLEWSNNYHTAILYGIINGYDSDYLTILQQKFNWDDNFIIIIQRDYEVFQTLKNMKFDSGKYISFFEKFQKSLDYFIEVASVSDINWRETEELCKIYGLLVGWDTSSEIHIEEKFKRPDMFKDIISRPRKYVSEVLETKLHTMDPDYYVKKRHFKY